MTTCWFYRLWATLGARELGDEPERVRRHRLGCRACRARAAADRRLAGDLSAEAQRTRLPAPPFLARRIVQTLRRATPPARGPLRPVLRLAQVAVPLSLILVAAHWATRDGTRPGGEARPPGSSDAAGVPGASSLSPLARPATLPAVDRFFELGQALDQPLQAEFDAVVQDARTAVQFLASNFLPERQPR